MKTSLKGKIELAGHEDIGLSKYLDSKGVWTIGIGATSTEIPDLASWPLNKTITIQEAFDLFEKSLVRYENAINKNLIRPVTQEQYDALVSWCYNVGTGWADKATVIKLLNSGRATNQQLYNALMSFKKPPEITGRRTKEAKLLTGQGYQNGGKVMVFPINNKGIPQYSKGKNITATDYLGKQSESVQLQNTTSNSLLDKARDAVNKFTDFLQRLNANQ